MLRIRSVALTLGFAGAALLALGTGSGGRVLYNGIRLPAEWPPARVLTREVMPVPYLKSPPAVIPIDMGRQLFVDDFLIERTTLRRTFHRVEYHAANPVLRADKPWERSATAFSDGVWHDPADRLFKAWYSCGPGTCYATSTDGIHWDKPALDVEPGTNIVLPGRRDSTTVWLDANDKEPSRRFKMLRYTVRGEHAVGIHFSPDGIHWSEAAGRGRTFSKPNYDRTTMFFNPFRDIWVYSLRASNVGPMAFPDLDTSLGRVRYYKETKNPAEGWESNSEFVPWTGADRLDAPHPQIQVPAQLYNLDANAYESLLVGLFTIWRGPNNEDLKDRPKRNEVFLGFSRDGFHWDRPDRRAFLAVSERRGDWNWGNVQSAGGVCVINGDRLHFYFSGRRGDADGTGASPDSGGSTGLATLRRDGFASMDAGESESVLETRPVRFSGKRLFVNVEDPEGELRVELLDARGRVLEPFSRDRSVRVHADRTSVEVRWQGGADISRAAGRPVRLRFHLRKGRLYSFWVSGEPSGASRGYVAAGGPGFTEFTDTTGR